MHINILGRVKFQSSVLVATVAWVQFFQKHSSLSTKSKISSKILIAHSDPNYDIVERSFLAQNLVICDRLLII